MSTKQCKCGSEFFRIEEKDCSDCPHNGAWLYDEKNEEGEYIYDEAIIKEKGLSRNQAQDENQCNFGDCYNEGCYMFTCSVCSKQTNLPLGVD